MPRVDIADRDIARMYRDERRTGVEISAALGCSASTVDYRLARMGIPRRPPRPRHIIRPPAPELRRLYISLGLSLRRIATQYGVTPQAVRGWLGDADIPRRRPGAPTPAWTADDLVSRYQAGDSALQVADDVGCSIASVYRALQTAGVPRRPVKPSITRDALIDGLSRGLSAPEMAAKHDVSVTCVCRALAREGLATASRTARRRRQRLFARGDRAASERSPESADHPTYRGRTTSRQRRPATPKDSPRLVPTVAWLAEQRWTGASNACVLGSGLIEGEGQPLSVEVAGRVEAGGAVAFRLPRMDIVYGLSLA